MMTVLLRQAASLIAAVAVSAAAAAADPLTDAVAEADALVAEGRLEEATGRLDDALARHPDSALLHLRLGGVELLRQRHAEAVGAFKAAVRAGSEGAGAFVGLGMAYLHMGRYGPARAALEEAARRDPARRADVERVLAWLDDRAMRPPH
jgi:tetratricopeptide (TPR) repeat protein